MKKVSGWSLKLLLSAALVFGTAPSYATLDLHQEPLMDVQSPYTMGQWGLRFDFQHAFTTPFPQADLRLTLGVLPKVDVYYDAFLNNTEASGFGQDVKNDYTDGETGILYQALTQEEGMPLTLGFGGAWSHQTFSTELINASGDQKVSGNDDFYSVRAMLYRSVTPWLALYVEPRWVNDQNAKASWDTVSAGGRLSIVDQKWLHLDLIGDRVFVAKQGSFIKSDQDGWSVGLQFKAGHSPHIFTLFAQNTVGRTAVEASSGGASTYYGFRWSHRF